MFGVPRKSQALRSWRIASLHVLAPAANLNIHLHCLVLDGVYRINSQGAPVFQPARAPSVEALHALLVKIITRLTRLLTRHGYLDEEQGMSYLAEPDAHHALTALQAASCTYRIALGPRAGHKVLSLHGLARTDKPSMSVLCSAAHGFGMHAVRCGAEQRRGLELLCRFITRPAIADERLRRDGARQVFVFWLEGARSRNIHVAFQISAVGPKRKLS